jgi:NAD(P)-dependent dehydrogenase (short-subunit alcohol dehydrogenase family)
LKKILIIGASSEIAQDFIQKNSGKYELYLAARNTSNIKNCISIDFDRFDENCFDELPQINGVVFCAGITSHMPVKLAKKRHYDSVFNANFFGAFISISTLLKTNKILPDSSLVFLSSVAAHYPYFGGALYVSSKMALEGFIKTLAIELASKKIQVNGVSPSFVKGEMTDSVNNFTEESTMQKFNKKHPFGIIEKSNVTSIIEFLLGDSNKAITGQILQVGNFNTGINN